MSTSESVEPSISCRGGVAAVIIFLQMLERELRGGGERGGKTSAAATISNAALGVIYPSLYVVCSTTSSIPMETRPPARPLHPHPGLCFPPLHIQPLPPSQEAAGAACVYC